MAVSSSGWHIIGSTIARLGLTANPPATHSSDAIVS
jgi:hypothetical protein